MSVHLVDRGRGFPIGSAAPSTSCSMLRKVRITAHRFKAAQLDKDLYWSNVRPHQQFVGTKRPAKGFEPTLFW